MRLTTDQFIEEMKDANKFEEEMSSFATGLLNYVLLEFKELDGLCGVDINMASLSFLETKGIIDLLSLSHIAYREEIPLDIAATLMREVISKNLLYLRNLNEN